MRRNRNLRIKIIPGVLILVGIFILVSLYGCAGKDRGAGRKRLPPTRPEQGEVIRPTKVAPPSEVLTPERRASMKLVENGQAHLDLDEFELAMTTFRDAVNVDTTNGVAYYYLALTHYYLGRPDQASGLLDKADALLADDEAWKAKVMELRVELGEETPATYSAPESKDDGSF